MVYQTRDNEPDILSTYMLKVVATYIAMGTNSIVPMAIITSRKIATIICGEGISVVMGPRIIKRSILGYRWVECEQHSIMMLRCHSSDNDRSICAVGWVKEALDNTALINHFPHLKDDGLSAHHYGVLAV